MRKLKLTLMTAAVVFSLHATAAPLSLPQVDLGALLSAGTASFSEQARLGGFRMSRARPAARNFGGDGARSTRSQNTNQSANTNQNRQQDAQFSPQSPYRNATTGAGAATMPGYTGSPFLSSLTGTMTGMLLANMLFGSTAQAATQTAPVTPEKLTDAELQDCINTLDSKMAELEATRGDILNGNSETKDADLAQLDKDLEQLKDLQLRLLKERVNRLG